MSKTLLAAAAAVALGAGAASAEPIMLNDSQLDATTAGWGSSLFGDARVFGVGGSDVTSAIAFADVETVDEPGNQQVNAIAVSQVSGSGYVFNKGSRAIGWIISKTP